MSERPKIRVLVADDHPLARSGIHALLTAEGDFDVIAQAEDGAQAVAAFKRLRPDVCIMDLRMPVLDGVSAVRAIREVDPDARVIVLSHYDGDEDVFDAIRSGARGYLTKQSRGEVLAEAIRTVMSGLRYLPAEIAAKLADRSLQPNLSLRERQVLEGVFAGRSNREIAESLHIAERTASLHVSNLMTKLGARSRTEAVSIALQRGLIKSS
jgi:two-component system NarL family response regulator